MCVLRRPGYLTPTSSSSHPNWLLYSESNRETMIFNNEIRPVNDPQHTARLAMEKVLKLS